MEPNKYPERPEWLTDERIEYYRQKLRDCPNPLTDEELSNWEYDGYNDMDRFDARIAFNILSHFGLLEEQE